MLHFHFPSARIELAKAALIAVALLVSSCGAFSPNYSVSQLQQAPPVTSPNQLATGLPTSCSLSVSNSNPTIGQPVTFQLQTIPFGPTINACLSGAHNGQTDWNCMDSQPTGPSAYQVSFTPSVGDVGIETRYAEVTDASGNLLCTTNTVVLNIASSSTTGGTGGSAPTAIGGTATQPCLTLWAPNTTPELYVGGTAAPAIVSLLSTTNANLKACWYGTKSGAAIQDCWIPSANGQPSASPQSIASATGTQGTGTGYPWTFLAGDWGDYSLYAKIIATSNGTVTNVATGKTTSVTAGQVVCQTQGQPLTFTVEKATCDLSSNKEVFAQGEAATWKIGNTRGSLKPYYTQTVNSQSSAQNAASVAYPGNAWSGSGYSFLDPAFTAASAGVIDRTAILRDLNGQDACVTNTVEVVVEPSGSNCSLSVNQTQFSVASEISPIFALSSTQSNVNAYWYGSLNGIPDAQGEYAGSVGPTSSSLQLVEPPYSSTQTGTYIRYLLITSSTGAPLCVTPPLTLLVTP